MEEIISQQHSAIGTFYQEKLVPVFLNKITEHHQVILKIEELQKKLTSKNFENVDKHIVIGELNIYKSALEALVSSCFSSLKIEKEILFQDYYTSLNTQLETLDEVLKRTQDKERFLGIESDSKILIFRKKIKYLVFIVSKIPFKAINFFRKTKKEVIFWQQEIPLKNATEYYFKSELSNNLSVVVDTFYKEISETINKYWSIDKKIDGVIKHYLENDIALVFSDKLFSEVSEIPSAKTRIDTYKVAFNKVFEATFLKYTNALYIADTIELSRRFFNIKKITNYQRKVQQKSQKDKTLWQNTFNIFKSDWELDLEIFQIIFKVLFVYSELEKSIHRRTTTIEKELEGIKKYVHDVKLIIIGTTTDTAIKNSIISELKNLKTNFQKIIDKAILLVTNQEISLQNNQFEESVHCILKTLSTKRGISTDTDYSSKTASSAINYISPYELVSYQSWPSFAEKIKRAKLELNLKVTTFIDDINALDNVIEFNLESALSLFENISQENTPKKVALEGLERSEEQIEYLKNILSSWNIANGELLLPSIGNFNKSILALTDTENILEIRLTIAKAKSIEKSKLLKNKVTNNVKNFIPIVVLFIRTMYLDAVAFVKSILYRTGLYKEITAVNSDLSVFLKQAEKALDELPYVYQRLFRSETLQNETLFIGRVGAIETLKIACDTFDKNNFAATIIVGERGAGKTSLIHYFLNKNKQITEAIFLSPNINISALGEFIGFLNISFEKDFKSIEECIQFLNSGKKKTIVLENIHFLYFRKVGGFNVLHQLYAVISATKKNVFWIVTSAKYAFQYLDKLMQLSELFAFTIEMNEIDKETIKEALIKRHKISGYNLYFEKPPVSYLSKKFLKSTLEIQQESLKEEFFNDIHKIAQSNYKIAFMYWIRSTVLVSGSTIHMRSLKTIDTSFLNKIAPIKLLMLNSILLQERLHMNDIIELSSLDAQHTQNMVHHLLENGLLTIDDGEFFTINIFLYRQITSLLKSKNVIH